MFASCDGELERLDRVTLPRLPDRSGVFRSPDRPHRDLAEVPDLLPESVPELLPTPVERSVVHRCRQGRGLCSSTARESTPGSATKAPDSTAMTTPGVGAHRW